jgi:long-chain acyl-CoA synthetase
VSALIASFARIVDSAPTRRLIHLPATGTSLTAAQLWDARAAHADLLRACAVGAGDLVLIAAGNRAVYPSLLLAIRQLNAAVLAVDGGTPAPEIHELCARFGATACVVPIEQASPLGDVRATLPDGLVVISPPTVAAQRVSYDGVAMLKLTSGSTGLPKAAKTTDEQLIVDTRQIIAAMGIGPDDTQIAAIPLSHAYGNSVVLMPMLLQGTPIVLRESFVPHQLPSDALACSARVLAGVPFMFEYFLANPPAGGWPGPLRTLISAGARLKPATIKGFFDRFGVRIHSFYGTTESGGISYDDVETVDPHETVGRPIPGVTITFRDDDGQPASRGRVHVSSAGVADGYVGEAAGDFDERGFLTGDFGTFDADGRLVLTGRISSFINVAGKKVQPTEVETVLREMPGVRDVRVLGAIDPQRGEQVVACIVCEPIGRPPAILAVRRFCSARLASHKIPRLVVCLDAWPLTSRGKIDRRALDEAVRAAMADLPEQLC